MKIRKEVSLKEVDIRVPKTASYCTHIKDKYYVYALFKRADCNPFYIGKGINNRIDQHFMECSLKESDSRKNKTIRKYKDSIRKEILCYFDAEKSAFDFEEYLISYYGLVDEGGCLLNVAKTRHEIPASTKKIISEKKTGRIIVYSEDEVLRLYRNYFERRMSLRDCVEGTTIPYRYSSALCRGEKFKGLFAKYVKSGLVQNLRTPEDNLKRKHPENQKVSDQDLINIFEKVCNLEVTLREACEEVGTSPLWVARTFKGDFRKYLNFDYDRYKNLPKGKYINQERSYLLFKQFYSTTTEVEELVEKVGKSKSRIHAYIRRYNKESTEERV